MMRARHGIDAKRIAPRAVEGEIHIGLFAEILFETLLGSSAIFVITVSQGMFLVDAGDGFKTSGQMPEWLSLPKPLFIV